MNDALALPRAKSGLASASAITIDTFQGTQVLGLGTHTPPTYSQRQLMDDLGLTGDEFAEKIFKNLQIERRSFNKTLGQQRESASMDALGEYHRRFAPEMAAEALRAAAGNSHELGDLDALVVATSTGYMMPGVAEVLAEKYGIGRKDALHFNLVGQGCVAVVPALQVARGLIASSQARRVGVVCSEPNAALFDPTQEGKVAVIKHLLFGEGAAALILGSGGSSAHGLPVLVDSQQEMASGALDIAAVRHGSKWEATLGENIPDITAELLPRVVDKLLARHGLTVPQVRHWAFHTGGRKVLEVCQEGLNLSEDQMAPSHHVMRMGGNMNSCSVLFSLQRVIEHHRPQPGDVGVLVAVGPGLIVGAFLMRWPT